MGGPTHPRATWRGVLTCARMAEILDAAAARLPEGDQYYGTQGSFTTGVSASGNTHAGCGVIDVSRFRRDGREWAFDELVRFADAVREVGGFGWARPELWSGGKRVWTDHAHVAAKDCAEMATALIQQQNDYMRARDGLLPRDRNGLSINPDTGSRAWVDVTWEDYQASHNITPPPPVQEDDMQADERAALFEILGRDRDLHNAMTALKGGPGNELFMPFFVAAAAGGTYAIVKSEGLSGGGDPNYNGNARVLAAVQELRAALEETGAVPAPAPAPALAAATPGARDDERAEADPEKVLALALGYAQTLLPAAPADDIAPH